MQIGLARQITPGMWARGAGMPLPTRAEFAAALPPPPSPTQAQAECRAGLGGGKGGRLGRWNGDAGRGGRARAALRSAAWPAWPPGRRLHRPFPPSPRLNLVRQAPVPPAPAWQVCPRSPPPSRPASRPPPWTARPSPPPATLACQTTPRPIPWPRRRGCRRPHKPTRGIWRAAAAPATKTPAQPALAPRRPPHGLQPTRPRCTTWRAGRMATLASTRRATWLSRRWVVRAGGGGVQEGGGLGCHCPSTLLPGLLLLLVCVCVSGSQGAGLRVGGGGRSGSVAPPAADSRPPTLSLTHAHTHRGGPFPGPVQDHRGPARARAAHPPTLPLPGHCKLARRQAERERAVVVCGGGGQCSAEFWLAGGGAWAGVT